MTRFTREDARIFHAIGYGAARHGAAALSDIFAAIDGPSVSAKSTMRATPHTIAEPS